MAPSSRDFFLALNNSNALIKLVSVPICALVFAAPLLLLAVRFFYPQVDFSAYAARCAQPIPAPFELLATISVALLATRFATGRCGKSGEPDACNGARKVPRIPFWVPGLGHLPDFIFNNKDLMRRTRDSSAHGIFALNLGGSTHNIIHSPSLIEAVLASGFPVTSHDVNEMAVQTNVFGFPAKLAKGWAHLIPASGGGLSKSLMENHLLATIKVFQGNLHEHLPNLVTFMDSLVDQMPWERISNVCLVAGAESQPAVETSLLLLVREFLGHMSAPALVGTAFTENYPQLQADLSLLDSSFFLLGMALPRWFALPGLVPAYISKKRLLTHFITFRRSLQAFSHEQVADSSYREFSDVNEVLFATQQVFDKYNLPLEVGAGTDLSLLWDLSTRTHLTAFWMLLHIFSYSPDLVRRLRTETAPHACAVQPPQILGIAEPPSIRVNIDSLLRDCPLLKSCYIETIRLYSRTWTVHKVEQSCSITEGKEDTIVGAEPASFRLSKDEYVNVAHELHHMDPRYFIDPLKWVPERHLAPVRKERMRDGVVWGSVRADAGAYSLCNMQGLAEKYCLAFVAGFLQLWDMEPASSNRAWSIPKPAFGTLIASPNGNARVRISRRLLSKTDLSTIASPSP